MDLPSLNAVTAYQAEFPPLNVMVRNYLGIKPAVTTPTEAPTAPSDAAVHEAASVMAERPLDATQAATVAILKAKGWA